MADPKGTWDNFSPEATLTWRPDQNLTIFGAYKTGFLSGGYNSGSGTWDISRKFEQTKIKGFEGGVKTQIGAIRANVGIYNYKLTGMQVSTIVPLFNPDGTPTGATSQLVTNAGGARVKGIEIDANWRTPLEGLTLRGAIGYNKARYTDFITTCYPGQTKSLGCNLTPLGPAAPNQTGTLQDLAGYQLVRAPDWNATIGGNFETPISSTWNIGLSGDAFYTSKYWMSATSGAGTRQSGYWQLDATFRVFSQDNGIEFAVIGKNLTNELYGTRGLEVPFSGFGGGTDGPSRFGDVYKNIARGREIMFRASKKF